MEADNVADTETLDEDDHVTISVPDPVISLQQSLTLTRILSTEHFPIVIITSLSLISLISLLTTRLTTLVMESEPGARPASSVL